jgi:hypothetical protein
MSLVALAVLAGASWTSTETVRLSKIPIKMRFEPQYSLIRSRDVGTAWSYRIQASLVIPSPFRD